jgi:hypothetical protein
LPRTTARLPALPTGPCAAAPAAEAGEGTGTSTRSVNIGSVGTVRSPLTGPLRSGATGTPAGPLDGVDGVDGVAVTTPAGGVAGFLIGAIVGILNDLPGTTPAGGVGCGPRGTGVTSIRSTLEARALTGPAGAPASTTRQVARSPESNAGGSASTEMSVLAPLGTVGASGSSGTPGSGGAVNRAITRAPSPSSSTNRSRTPARWCGPCGIVDDDRISARPAITGVPSASVIASRNVRPAATASGVGTNTWSRWTKRRSAATSSSSEEACDTRLSAYPAVATVPQCRQIRQASQTVHEPPWQRPFTAAP